ncbi:helix-turn-helix domain-containing protein [Salinispirillum sp. LH 10-3-1]|uniref:DNA-3-methyladenine glycosylase II n=1 Tax=Salinispirillum sp. LH 10-3-1 TaxID=2952525 RepID=A0AB38YGK8_9GAMM
MTELDTTHLLATADWQRARLARDARFDGLFFVAVKTTGIFCRPICPAVPPKEHNVEYFTHAVQAYGAGYRPCLRCRPDSAPGSCAWRGTDTTFQRALTLIDAGALQNGDMPALAARLGISDRYLRRLFQTRLGLSPKAYGLFGQVMFAKKLLHETALPMLDVAAAAGFHSLRRFNDACQKHLKMTPSAIRRQGEPSSDVRLTLAYRPPLNWQQMLAFWRARAIEGLEWVTDSSYGRTFTLPATAHTVEAKGWFEVSPIEGQACLALRIEVDPPHALRTVVQRVRQILDLDADVAMIEHHLQQATGAADWLTPGLRIPGIWSPFEAGIRAILGQQVSVAAARTHVTRLVAALGEPVTNTNAQRYFPTPEAIVTDSLDMLKMPTARRETVRRFAAWYMEHGHENDVEDWLTLKGIGRWTLDYVRMRALGEPDVWLGTDLGVKKALAQWSDGSEAAFDADRLAPWRSYATFHLWSKL